MVESISKSVVFLSQFFVTHTFVAKIAPIIQCIEYVASEICIFIHQKFGYFFANMDDIMTLYEKLLKNVRILRIFPQNFPDFFRYYYTTPFKRFKFESFLLHRKDSFAVHS